MVKCGYPFIYIYHELYTKDFLYVTVFQLGEAVTQQGELGYSKWLKKRVVKDFIEGPGRRNINIIYFRKQAPSDEIVSAMQVSLPTSLYFPICEL